MFINLIPFFSLNIIKYFFKSELYGHVCTIFVLMENDNHQSHYPAPHCCLSTSCCKWTFPWKHDIANTMKTMFISCPTCYPPKWVTPWKKNFLLHLTASRSAMQPLTTNTSWWYAIYLIHLLLNHLAWAHGRRWASTQKVFWSFFN